MTPRPQKSKLTMRACAILSLAAAIASLIGCESALSPPSALHDEAYTQSMIGRAIYEGSVRAGHTPTIDGGVHEHVRVDQSGPAYLTIAPTTAPGTGADTQPEAGGIYSINDAGLIGLNASQLNIAEAVKDLTLQEAIYRAAKHNLAIRVEAYNPAIKESQIIEAEAALDPVFFGQSQWTSTDEPTFDPLAQGLTNGQSWQNQVGIRQLLPSGAQAQVSVSDTWHAIDLAGVPPATAAGVKGFQTSYTGAINLSVTQPLLQNFGSAVTEANIYLAQRDYRISLSQFKQRAIEQVAQVEEGYQNLVLARTNVEILERLVVATEQTYRIVKEREGIDATKASIAQALQAVWSRRADLLTAQKTYRATSDKLKSLLNDPEFDVNSNVLINPVDRPVAEPVYYDANECADTALSQRPELQQARLQVERADIVVKVAQNGLLPKLDLTIGLQANGLDHTAQGGIGTAIDPANFLDFNAGIKFEIPIGNRDAEAVLRRRVNERKQALENLVEVAQNIVLDVRTQVREVKSNYESLDILDKARQAAADEFEGIIQIEDIRARTPEFLQLKLDSQARLATAEQSLIQSLVNYNLAIMHLEQSKGTLLEFDRISLARPPEEPDNGLNILRFLGTDYLRKK